MKTTKISFYELMEEMDEDFWSAVSSKTASAGYGIRIRETAPAPVRKFCIRKKVRSALFPARNRKMRAYRLAGLFLALAMVSSVTVYSLSKMTAKNARIDDSNRHQIGKETCSDTYYIYENGAYYDNHGAVVDMEALCLAENFDPSRSRIVKNMDDLAPLSSPVSEFPVRPADSATYDCPEILLVNASPAVLTKPDGSGWILKPGDSFSFAFETYPSETVSGQKLHIGFVKNGVLYRGETFSAAAGACEYTAEEEGEYYPYVVNLSSDPLALKKGALSVR